ncbi:MAG: DMT family transporter [Prolixibacteraceae bacterium]|nr:DMT family transporter [Prolixibacteraceae bacterium]
MIEESNLRRRFDSGHPLYADNIMKQASKAYIYALCSVVLWSTVATAFKLGLKELSPLYLILMASTVSLLTFFIVILVQGKTKELFAVSWSGLGKSALLGALNPFGYYLILFEAYSLLPAQVAQPLNMVWPITLALLSAPLLKQKITFRNIIAILISFIGVIFISSQGSLSGIANTNPTGALLAVGSSIIWALFWILSVLDKRDEIFKLFWNFAFGLIYLLIAAFLFTDFELPGLKGLPAAIYIGLFELGITYILWMKAMQLSENNAKTGNLIFLSPFLSLVFIHFILGEKIFITTFIGLAFIISGIWVQQKK